VEVYASEGTIEIADFESLPAERRRFALINVPRQQFIKRQAKLHAARQEKIAEMIPPIKRTAELFVQGLTAKKSVVRGSNAKMTRFALPDLNVAATSRTESRIPAAHGADHYPGGKAHPWAEARSSTAGQRPRHQAPKLSPLSTPAARILNLAIFEGGHRPGWN
jgi:hypothetical protein